MADEKPNLLVLGGGIVGLHTAIRLEQDYPHAKVTVMAPRNVKDREAAGATMFRPSTRIAGTNSSMNMHWIKSSWGKFFNF